MEKKEFLGKIVLKCLTILWFVLIIKILRKPDSLDLKQGLARDKKLQDNNETIFSGNIVNQTEQHDKQQQKTNEIEQILYPKYIGPGIKNSEIRIKRDGNYSKLRQASLQSDVNVFLSDVIGFKRILPDWRPEECKVIKYPENMPEISIVIVFRDEPISCLLRTIYSILETSPDDLVHEVILVDDGSENMDLKLAVKIHVSNVKKLKLIENKKSLGLMMARQKGIEAVESEYFIVLDGHIEVTPGWLEPVIYRLVQKPNALLTSHVGVIHRENFKVGIGYYAQQLLIFDQITLAEQWVSFSKSYLQARNKSVEPIEYALVPGMMVAMRKEFFIQLGGFDPGMEIWGSEHMELSTKVWLCGGIVEMLPCSKVFHLYRGTPWQKMFPDAKYIWKNKLRFILVWMEGEVQKIALEVLQKGTLSKDVHPGDLRDRYRIKVDNKCKPYQYYLDQVRRISNAFIPGIIKRKGIISNQALKTCLDMADIANKVKLITYPCSGNPNQFFILTDQSNIRVDRAWFKAELETQTIKLSRDFNDWSTEEFKWSYERNGTIVHKGMCLTGDNSGEVSLKTCEDSPLQRWDWPPNDDQRL